MEQKLRGQGLSHQGSAALADKRVGQGLMLRSRLNGFLFYLTGLAKEPLGSLAWG